eukprot:1145754-Pelagomonas_calceolata.AAC.2
MSMRSSISICQRRQEWTCKQEPTKNKPAQHCAPPLSSPLPRLHGHLQQPALLRALPVPQAPNVPLLPAFPSKGRIAGVCLAACPGVLSVPWLPGFSAKA